jgi:hypothetical protein
MLSQALPQTLPRPRVADAPAANDNSERSELRPQHWPAHGYVPGAPLAEWEWTFCWFPKTTRVGGRTHAITSLQRRKVADRVSLERRADGALGIQAPPC